MFMKTILILASCFFTFATSLVASVGYCAAEWIPPTNFYTLAVSVKVDGPGNDSARAESYIRNKLGDHDGAGSVVFRDSDTPFILHVALRPAQNTNNALTTWELEAVAQTTAAKPKKEIIAAAGVSSGQPDTEMRWKVSGNTETLKQLCEKVASQFEKKILAPARERREIYTPADLAGPQRAKESWEHSKGHDE